MQRYSADHLRALGLREWGDGTESHYRFYVPERLLGEWLGLKRGQRVVGAAVYWDHARSQAIYYGLGSKDTRRVSTFFEALLASVPVSAGR